MTMMARTLRYGRAAQATAGLASFLALSAIALALDAGASRRSWLARMAWQSLLWGFGLRLQVKGRPVPGSLFVANHVSWADIPVLGLLTRASFVTKSEVGTWPVIGPMARRLGCVFVERDRRMAAAGQADAVRARLADGPGLILFPEGTTSDGTRVLPFRSSLFAVTGHADGMRPQPVGIRYRAPDGSLLAGLEQRAVAWLGHDALLPHAFALAMRGGAVVDVWFGPVLSATCRKQAAEGCRQAILGWLADVQAAELKRAA